MADMERKTSVTSAEINVGAHTKSRRYTLTAKDGDDPEAPGLPPPPKWLPKDDSGSISEKKLKKSFTITNLFKKRASSNASPKGDNMSDYRASPLHKSSPSLGSIDISPRTSNDSLKGRKDLTFTHSEARRITTKLDDLANKAQNPLLGLDSDEEEELLNEEVTPQFFSTTSAAQLAAMFPEDSPEEKAVLVRTIETIFKMALDPSKGWTADMLPPVAAIWYPPELWPANSEAVFDRENYMLPEEEMISALEREIKKVENLLHKKQAQLKSLMQEDLQMDQELLEKEIKKRKDHIRTLEYKQWKLMSQIERITDKSAVKPSQKVEQVVVEEKNEEGKVIREIRVKDGKHSVQAGTMEALILSLFDESNQDVTYVDDFLLSFRMYISSPDLLKQISTLFDSGKIKSTSAARVGLVLKKWIQKYWTVDFGVDNLQPQVDEFWTKLAPAAKSTGKEVDYDLSFLARMSSKQDEINADSKFSALRKKRAQEPRPVRNYGDQSEENPWSFLAISKNQEEFATILGEIELRFYQAIKPEEFLEKLMWKGGPEEVNPKTLTLFGLINWVNQLGYWMATEICLCYDLKDRTRVLTRFIEIAREAAKIGCFNTVFAIITGLSNSSIARLKQTWSGLNKKIQADFNDLEDICNPQFNYKKYRKLESEAQPPFIPFIGMHMRDMFFMNDGNPSKLASGLMTFDKLRTLIRSIDHVLSFQKKTFISAQIKDEKLVDYIEHINSVEPLQDRHLHKMSCQCEPPEWRKRANFNRRADDLLI